MEQKRVGDLEINEDLRFQRREWKAERVGWSVLVAVILIAGAGVFGHGPISWTSATTPGDALRVDYERFGRRGGPQALVVEVSPSQADGGEWQVEVTREYLAGFDVDAITPEPDSVESTDRTVRYTFSQAQPSASLKAKFSVTPSTLWSTTGSVSVAGGPAIQFRQFFFP